MRLQPNQQLLDIWRATTDVSLRHARWSWGGRAGSNSISDAEQLLCLLLPATDLPGFKLDRPEETSPGALDALQMLGDAGEIPRTLVELQTEYYERYIDETGRPTFAGDGYLESTEPGEPVSAAQRSVDLVSSFAASVTLALATIGFVRVFHRAVTRDQLRRRLDRLDALASRRLTAAMVGLLRSFSINSLSPGSPESTIQCRLIGGEEFVERDVISRMRRRLRETLAAMRELTIGSGQAVGLDDPDRLVECGWSWGIVPDAPTVPTTGDIGAQPEGVAEDAPYLVFTIVALTAVDQLLSERTRILGLLDDEQQRLARALQLRRDITTSFWSTLATFGDGAWPLEDIPWRTTDDWESDYFSVLVSRLIIHNLLRQPTPANTWSRLAAILIELASRGRITRRPLAHDPALRYHKPGIPILLHGAQRLGGPVLHIPFNDYAPLLLESVVSVAGQMHSADQRHQLLDLADRIWVHIAKRRLVDGVGRGLWDEPAAALGLEPPPATLPSWYYTARVVQSLVVTAHTLAAESTPSDQLTALAVDLLGEAERRYDQESLTYSTTLAPELGQVLKTTSADLRLAREIVGDEPGSAAALALDVLREMNTLHKIRRNSAATVIDHVTPRAPFDLPESDRQ